MPNTGFGRFTNISENNIYMYFGFRWPQIWPITRFYLKNALSSFKLLDLLTVQDGSLFVVTPEVFAKEAVRNNEIISF
jgi:hypothetical protein